MGSAPTPERQGRIRELFAAALELPVAQRDAFLARICESDPELLAEIKSLLSEASSTATSIMGARLRPPERGNLGGNSEEEPDLAGKSLGHLRLNQRYQVQRELGRGHFGIVYLATDEVLLSKRVVVKIMRNTAPTVWEQRKFHDEIKALARLNHPGIVSVLDTGKTDDGRPFLVMEYVEGVLLRSLMRPQGMDLDPAADIIRQIGTALEAAHRNGILHRDLKPENVMIQAAGPGDQRVKLIDFGVASVRDDEAPPDSTQIAGTFRYMAPEQLAGKPCTASDIYALGVITYEMVTGRVPFPAETWVELHQMQREGVQIPPRALRPDLPENAERILLRALQFAEHDRPSSVASFAEEFAQVVLGVRRPQRTARREPHGGRLVPKMCDRRSQEDAFRIFLAQNTLAHPGRPVFCLLPGQEGECHESLVERLAYAAEMLTGNSQAGHELSIKIARIPWQYDGSAKVRLGRLTAWLFERFSTAHGLRVDNTSAEELALLLASMHLRFIFLQHDIRVARWDHLTKPFIQAYMAYMAGLPSNPAGPQIVVCLNVIYQSLLDKRSSRLFQGPIAKVRKIRIRRQLADIVSGANASGREATCTSLLLDELRSITRDDVLEWFSLHNIFETEEQRLQAAGRMFGRSRAISSSRSMAEIETQLRDVQHNCLVQQGFL
jgi:serine/threonine-protein kinase